RLAHRLPIAHDLKAVITHLQLAYAIAAVDTGGDRARRSGLDADDGDLVSCRGPPGHRAGGALCMDQARCHGRQAQACSQAQNALAQTLVLHCPSPETGCEKTLPCRCPLPLQDLPLEAVAPLIEIQVPPVPLGLAALQVDRLRTRVALGRHELARPVVVERDA